jgi:hypothetical protein
MLDYRKSFLHLVLGLGLLSLAGCLWWTSSSRGANATSLPFADSLSLQPDCRSEVPKPPGTRFPDAEHFFQTDLGSLLPVFNWLAPPEEYEAFAESSDRHFRQRFSLTRTSPPTLESNCHGWVFLRGKFLIFAEQVERILGENGYRQVAEPSVGDVIIYRDPSGEILHSGLVWWVGADGQALIQSKFGISGRYLHAPLDQPYGDRFCYYRADRRRHAVRIRSTEAAVQP